MLRCLLVARKESLTGVSTGLTGRSKNLDPTGRSTQPVSISATQILLKKCRSGGELLASGSTVSNLTGPRFEPLIRAPETNALKYVCLNAKATHPVAKLPNSHWTKPLIRINRIYHKREKKINKTV